MGGPVLTARGPARDDHATRRRSVPTVGSLTHRSTADPVILDSTGADGRQNYPDDAVPSNNRYEPLVSPSS